MPRLSIFKRKRNGLAVARGNVGRDQKLQRLETFAAVGFRLGLATQHVHHILVVERMA
ncbi:oxidoreductase domain protein (plasmid) [Agrobacterium sp. RAC06]|nr:oxidoreductase domain protein [Agrobacterium sp. RAC06]